MTRVKAEPQGELPIAETAAPNLAVAYADYRADSSDEGAEPI
jgi:hypothetical protein